MSSNDIRYQKGVGPKIAQILERLGIGTVNDLIYYFPREYEDRSKPAAVSSLKFGEEALIKVSVVKLQASRTRRNFSIIKGLVKDATGTIGAIWFNQPFLVRILKPGTQMFMTGKLEKNDYSGDIVFVPRTYEVITPTTVNELIVPRYPLTEGMTQKMLRRIVRNALTTNLKDIKDPLPESIKKKYGLAELVDSIKEVHFPSHPDKVEIARRRLAFDELLMFQLGLVQNRMASEKLVGIPFRTEGELLDKFKARIPFRFTGAQERVTAEIINDMKSRHVMNRLIQGDVGSGKTVIAMYAMVAAVQSGYQAAIMAPTEILANQHYKKIKALVDDIGIKVVLLTGSEKAGRKEIYEQINSGEPCIIIGTHALIESKVNFGKLGLVVIDEQHRFGVDQRIKLREKGKNIDLVVMTATPIPRTLALTLYGDLDRSIIDEMPPNRTKIITRYISEAERKHLYEFIRKEIAKGRQAYVVCPLVMESELSDLKAAKEEAEALKKLFPEFHVGLIHGQMKSEEKDKVMSGFAEGKVQILVSTTVIEVGIDVPNSTIMVIEHAERFGLSQLHQLRGRIGRGSQQSYCFLVADPKSPTSKARIEAMLKTDDGFKIAEADLKLRGPGEFFGTSQSGLPNFRVADIITDEKTIRETREAASFIIENSLDISGFNLNVRGNTLE